MYNSPMSARRQVRRGRSTSQPLYRGHYTAVAGPWELIPTRVLSTDAGTPTTFDQDPFLFSSPRGYHIVSNRAVGGADNLCGGGHLYSRDLVTWYVGETVFGTGNQCSIQFSQAHQARESDGADVSSTPTTTLLTSRERPVIFVRQPETSFLCRLSGRISSSGMHDPSHAARRPLPSAPPAARRPPPAVRCTHRVLIGACNPIACL